MSRRVLVCFLILSSLVIAAALPGRSAPPQDPKGSPSDVPNDSDYAAMQHVYLERVNAPAAWTLQKGNAGVVIATVDGGTYWNHPDLRDNIWINPGEDLNHDGIFQNAAAPAGDLNGIDDDHNGKIDDIIGWNFTYIRWDPRGSLPGSADHGTKTASVFGAVTNNNLGMAGTSWNCRIMPLCVADSVNDLRFPYAFGMTGGIRYAASMGASVINCSWAQAGATDVYRQNQQEDITAATEGGALVVCAAGNSHGQNLDEIPFYPASYDHVLAVGATEDTSDAVADFSNIGLNLVFAPGRNIRVALNNGAYNTLPEQGTSLAAPFVAGLAGLLKAAHPDWGPDQIATQIRMTADPIDASNPSLAGKLGHGRVNFYRALSEVHSGIVFESARFHKPSDTTTTFMTDDSVILSVKLRNVLPLAAENLSFSVSSDPGLEFLPPVVGPTRLDAGAGDSVHITFRVDEAAQGQTVSVRLGWNANTNEWDARIYKTKVYARTGIWKRQRSPATSHLFSVHAVSGTVAWASGHGRNGSNFVPAILRTTDGGENWSIVNGNLPIGFAAACIFALDSLHAWAGGGGWGGVIFATTNGGATWTRQNYPPPWIPFIIRGFWFFDPASGYALGDTGITGNRFSLLRTTDGGSTWTRLANEPVAEGGAEAVVNGIYCTDEQHIWFGASNSRVYRTTDGGATWSYGTVGTSRLIALAMQGDSFGIACTQDGPLMYARTTDGGGTWQTLGPIKSDMGWGAAFPAGPKAWIAGGPTVACSPDHGEHWVAEPTGPFSGDIIAISFADPENGWMTTTLGEILRYSAVPGAVPPEPGGTVPTHALLYQNFPNPFNPGTIIKYDLPRASTVTLKLYDILGREVAVLVDRMMDAGTHEVRFDGSRLASGVYFYRLQTHPLRPGANPGNFVQTLKLLLLR